MLVELPDFEEVLIQSQIVVADAPQKQQIGLGELHHRLGVDLRLVVAAGEACDVAGVSIDILLEIFILVLE